MNDRNQSRFTAPEDQYISDRMRKLLLLASFSCILAFPLFVLDEFLLSLILQIFIFAIVVISYDLLFGFTGLLSFGHALFFGGGAYLVVMLSQMDSLSYLIAIPITLAIIAIVAMPVALISLRLTGVYFAIITLAFAQLAHESALQFREYTGGQNGLSGFSHPTVAGFDFGETLVAYYILAISFISVFLFVRKVIQSPFGRVLQGIRENEERVQMLGISTLRFKTASFVLSSITAAFAGALYPLYISFISPSLLYWTTTGDILIMTLIGGIGTLWGGVVGAGFFILVKELFKTQFEQWRIFFGLLFVFFVLFFPSGLAGLIKHRLRGPTLVTKIRAWRTEGGDLNDLAKFLRREDE